MQAKIEWYKEVLRLDPESRLFFPLARLLVETGEPEQAVSVLEAGLEHHPEFLEARLFLVEVLALLGRQDQAQGYVEPLISVLAGYPAFWRLWAASVQDANSALALAFLSRHFHGERLSWEQVLLKGLQNMVETSSDREKKPEPETGADVLKPVKIEVASEDYFPGTEEQAELDLSHEEVDESFFQALSEMEGREAAFGEEDVFEEEIELGPDKEEPGKDEVTVRTRTMADILVKQGDVRGALEIYRDLLRTSPPGSRKDELAAVVRDLESRAGTRPAKAPAGEKKAKPPKGETSGVADTLKKLARRLEARALSGS